LGLAPGTLFPSFLSVGQRADTEALYFDGGALASPEAFAARFGSMFGEAGGPFIRAERLGYRNCSSRLKRLVRAARDFDRHVGPRRRIEIPH
jgi:hypothetical protein